MTKADQTRRAIIDRLRYALTDDGILPPDEAHDFAEKWGPALADAEEIPPPPWGIARGTLCPGCGCLANVDLGEDGAVCEEYPDCADLMEPSDD